MTRSSDFRAAPLPLFLAALTQRKGIPRRDGADVDIRDMKILLEDLGYSVDVRENLTASVTSLIEMMVMPLIFLKNVRKFDCSPRNLTT